MIIENEQMLLDAGFAKYDVPSYEPSSVDACYQKRYKDGKNTKYFLDVKHWDIKHPDTNADLGGYEINGQFYLKGTHNAINMTFLTPDLDEAENFINSLFDKGLLENYDTE